MQIKEFNEEVFYTNDKITKVTIHDIDFLKQKAMDNKRKRIRLCTHNNIKDPLHEMIIIHTKNTFIRPHKHLNKSESLLVLQGSADAIFFDEDGNITETIQMGDYESGRRFYYRICDPIYHMLHIKSDFFVFHESTNGPFNRSDTIFAPWSPKEESSKEVKKFIKEMSINLKHKLM